jgi:hypothetical protein
VNGVTQVYLEQLLELGDDVRWGTFLLATTNVGRRLDDVAKLVGQVVLAAHRPAVDSNTRTNWWRRNRHVGEDHPLGPRVFLGQAEEVKVVVGHLLEGGVNLRRREEPLVGLQRLDLLKQALAFHQQYHRATLPRRRL